MKEYKAEIKLENVFSKEELNEFKRIIKALNYNNCKLKLDKENKMWVITIEFYDLTNHYIEQLEKKEKTMNVEDGLRRKYVFNIALKLVQQLEIFGYPIINFKQREKDFFKFTLQLGNKKKTENEKTLKKAMDTEYKHKKWYTEGGKTVFEAINHYASSGDFYLDVSNRMTRTRLRSLGFDFEKYQDRSGNINRKDLIQWMIDNEKYDKLFIRFAGKEGGADRRVLKIKTYLILQGKL